MSMKETDRRWLPAERDALASEAIGGPSLTYWQAGTGCAGTRPRSCPWWWW